MTPVPEISCVTGRRTLAGRVRQNGGMGRRLFALLGLCLSMVVVGKPAPAAQALIPELGPCTVSKPLGPFDQGPEVFCLQFALAMGGFLKTPIGDVYDAATTTAVRYLQASRPPMNITGNADDAVLQYLGLLPAAARPEQTPAAQKAPDCLADAPTAQGDTGKMVDCLQHSLKTHGFYRGPISGAFDRQTADAVRLFQLRTPPLPVTGIAGPQSLAALGIWSGVTNGGTQRTMPVGASPGTPRQATDPGQPAPSGPWPSPPMELEQFLVDANGVPMFGNRGACTVANANIIAYEFARDGADVDTQRWAVYVASREGGCDYMKVNQNAATFDDSHCTFQLNALAGLFNPTAELGRRGWTPDNVKESMYNCADAASDLWVFCGRGPWIKPTYKCEPPWRTTAPTP